MSILSNILSIFNPRLCPACKKALSEEDEVLCVGCQYDLPESNFHYFKDNPVMRLFWGKVEIENAAAYYYFSKNGRVQRLIHNLKYRKKKEIAYYLGKKYGVELIKSEFYSNIEIIIPVPLHKEKEKQRGFNQSLLFAEGLAEVMNTSVCANCLSRLSNSDSQTKKKGYDRYKNVKDIFIAKNAELIEDKHILLVDDIITSGSTLEACVKALQTIKNVKISIAAIAFAGI